MLSIIICSISPERLLQVSQNIHETIGVEYEIVALDNRERNWSIARVYNEGARKANYSFLFFVHEDVKFHTQDWGRFIENKLSEPDCGVVGFAGSKARLNCYSGWMQDYRWVCACMYQKDKTETKLEVAHATLERPFEEVVVLDGMGLFVRKEVWEQFPFDEATLTGFHCYDLDFTLQIAASKRYKNYVCCTVQVLIEHFSLGNYNEDWYHETIRIHKLKWDKMLPLMVDGCHVSPKERKRLEEQFADYFLRSLFKTHCSVSDKKVVLKEFLSYPLSRKHLRRCVSYIYKYIFT